MLVASSTIYVVDVGMFIVEFATINKNRLVGVLDASSTIYVVDLGMLIVEFATINKKLVVGVLIDDKMSSFPDFQREISLNYKRETTFTNFLLHFGHETQEIEEHFGTRLPKNFITKQFNPSRVGKKMIVVCVVHHAETVRSHFHPKNYKKL